MMDQLTHFLFLAAMILVIAYTMTWLSSYTCLWGYMKTDPIKRLESNIQNLVDVGIASTCAADLSTADQAHWGDTAKFIYARCKVDCGDNAKCPLGYKPTGGTGDNVSCNTGDTCTPIKCKADADCGDSSLGLECKYRTCKPKAV